MVDNIETFAAMVLQPEGGPLTDEQFLAFCEQYPDYRIESTAEGNIVVQHPVPLGTSRRNVVITAQLGVWAERDGRGEGFDSSTGFILANGTRRSPDSALISNERWNTLSDDDAMWHATPEFVIELRSVSDRIKTLRGKMQKWIENGVSLAWLIDPKERTVEIYRTGATSGSFDGAGRGRRRRTGGRLCVEDGAGLVARTQRPAEARTAEFHRCDSIPLPAACRCAPSR